MAPDSRFAPAGILVLLVMAGLFLWQPAASSGAFPSDLACGNDTGVANPATGFDPIPPIIENRGAPVETHTYFCGPIPVYSGQNRIDYQPINLPDRPAEDGWITRLNPNLMAVKPGVRTVTGIEDLYTPPSDQVMFHHGVWLNLGQRDLTSNQPERFYATGEEKTELRLPEGFGYRYDSSRAWIMNHMIHNLVPQGFAMYITWEIDFIPETSPLADTIEPVRPIWMDVQNGCYYPVFDVERGDGGKDGKFTYPDDAADRELYCDPTGDRPYGQTNRWRVPQDGYLVSSVGHVHSGGLWTDLDLIRNGADTYGGPTCEAQSSRLEQARATLRNAEQRLARLEARKPPGKSGAAARSFKRQLAEANRLKRTALAAVEQAEADFAACDGKVPMVSTDSVSGDPKVRLFRSNAKYFDRIPGPAKSGPVSWDMGMFNTTEDYRVQLEQGDWLETSTTYETKIGSWYESMGIHISFMAFGKGGVDPFLERVDQKKELNHGPLPENSNHGGKRVKGAPDPSKMPKGLAPSDELLIGGYTFGGGDFMTVPGKAGRPLVVEQGKSLKFRLSEGDFNQEMWHSLTSCKKPCNRSTGIAYPLPNGEPVFDSGQLGPRIRTTGAVGTDEWVMDTKKLELKSGTYPFYCRIHPLMRGAVRVVPKK